MYSAGAKKEVGMDLTQGPIVSCIVRFALPIIGASMIQQLYGMVDLLIIGQFVGSVGTVGVSTGGEVADFLLPVATSMATAAQIYVGQMRGAGQMKDTSRAVGTTFTIMLGLAAVFMLVSFLFYTPILNALNCPEEAFSQAASYMVIVALGLPAVYGYNAICGVLRGMGESKRPMYFIAVAAVVNIFADLLFVVIFRMEAAGTAIATVLSQYGSFIAALMFMLRRNDTFKLEFSLAYFKPDFSISKALFRLGIPLAAKSLMIHFAMLWVNSNVNSYGLVASATNSIGNKLQKFVNMFTNSMDSAGASLIAQNLGAKKKDRARKIVLYTLLISVGLATCFALISFFFPKQLFSIFTTDEAVKELGVTFMRIMCVMYYLAAVAGALQSMVTGSGFASLSFVIGVSDGIVCRIGLSLLFATVMGMGVVGYFWAAALARTLGCIISLVYFVSGKWKTRKLLTDDNGNRRH